MGLYTREQEQAESDYWNNKFKERDKDKIKELEEKVKELEKLQKDG